MSKRYRAAYKTTFKSLKIICTCSSKGNRIPIYYFTKNKTKNTRRIGSPEGYK